MKHINLQMIFAVVVITLASLVQVAAQTTFSNSSPITIPNSGTASPYPSNITASGLSGAISRVTVTLSGYSHTNPADVGVLLVSPAGTTVDLMNTCGGGTDAVNVNLTFDDAAVGGVTSPITSGTYRPTQCSSNSYPSPAPSFPFGTTFFGLAGGNPNGTWKLFVADRFSGGAGSISGGWSVTIETDTNPGSLQLGDASYTGVEAGPVMVTITRANGLNGTVMVNYATSEGSATGGAACGAGVDYITASGTITFSGNTLSQSIVIQLCQDAISEPSETINLTLSNPTGGATLGTPSSAIVTIIDSPQQHIVDFDGDAKTDFSVVRNTGGGPNGQLTWWINLSGSNAATAIPWGLSGDFFVPQDYDGDNKTDIAVWRGSSAGQPSGNGFFYIFNTATNTFTVSDFGQTGDDPTVVGDYDGDGRADVAVYRSGATSGAPSTWYYRGSLNNPSGGITFVPWGQNGDFVAPGDYDGDKKADFVVQRNAGGGQARFSFLYATGVQPNSVIFGTATDVIVPGDYDGDGKTDLAVVRGSAGQLQWWIRPSSTGAISGPVIFGVSATDFTAQGDYDGDGKTDQAIWRPSATAGQSRFWVNGSTNGVRVFTFGQNGDYPVANYNRH